MKRSWDGRDRGRISEPSSVQRSQGSDQLVAAHKHAMAPRDADEREEGEVTNNDQDTAFVSEEVDPAVILAERRRKRAEILAKYAQQSAGQSTRAEELQSKRARTTSPAHQSDNEANMEDLLSKDESSKAAEHDREAHVARTVNDDTDQQDISAADYNPDEDFKRDQAKRAAADPVPPSHPIPRSDQDDDDDDDDMFNVSRKSPQPVNLDDKVDLPPTAVPIVHRPEALLVDNYDDSEGYYRLILGELLDNGRYHVHANLGKGMFSSVVRAKDLETGKQVAVKIVRSQESMYKAGQKEAAILKKLMDADPSDKRHVVRLERTFDHKGHLCLVFENLTMNLREVVKRFGKDVGLNLRAVRSYASQMCLALSLLRKCDIMHADLKPDNILVNESKSVLKVCDLGSASDVTENEITPYLVSRFYRAPEIILGLPYDCALDVWSIGCTLYELYTGKILFPGRTNNHMLLLIQELKGKFPHKMVKKARFGEQHFDDQVNFLYADPKQGNYVKRVALAAKPQNDLRSRLMPPSVVKRLKDDDQRLLGHFVDLLDKMLVLEPAKRITPKARLSLFVYRSTPARLMI